jgi:hypothetical protein
MKRAEYGQDHSRQAQGFAKNVEWAIFVTEYMYSSTHHSRDAYFRREPESSA